MHCLPLIFVLAPQPTYARILIHFHPLPWLIFITSSRMINSSIWAIPQKILPQCEENKLTYKVCFPLNINKEVLSFDDEEK